MIFLLWIPVALIHGFINIIAVIFGILLIPLALFFKAYKYRDSKYFDDPEYPDEMKVVLSWTWWFMYPWSNEEDGILCGEELIGKPAWMRIFYWSAIRNPANNLRFMIGPRPDPKKIFFKSSFYPGPLLPSEKRYEYLRTMEENGNFWYLAWQGTYAGLRVEYNGWRLWAGFKFYPSSIIKIQEYQRYGVGNTIQIKKVR